MAGDCASGGWVLRVLLGALMLVCFLSFLSIGAVSNRVIKASVIGPISPHDRFKHAKTLGRGQPVHVGHDLIYVSKRRVPNGPDPIHNRRVGETIRPPGRA